MIDLFFKKLEENVKYPLRAHERDAGFDLYLKEDGEDDYKGGDIIFTFFRKPGMLNFLPVFCFPHISFFMKNRSINFITV